MQTHFRRIAIHALAYIPVPLLLRPRNGASRRDAQQLWLEAEQKWLEAVEVAEDGGNHEDAASALRWAAYSAEQRGAGQRAIGYYTRSLGLSPQSGNVYNARALLYDEQDKHREAIADLDLAIRHAPNSPYWHSNRGNIKLRSGDCIGAIEDLQRASDLFGPNDPEARMELDNARQQCGGDPGSNGGSGSP